MDNMTFINPHPLLQCLSRIRRTVKFTLGNATRVMVAMLTGAGESQLSSSATSILFKLSCKLTPEDFVALLHRLCGYPAEQRPYNFIHLPWKQLAVVNFVSHEACDFCFRVLKCLAGVPGVPVADVREGLHQGLEANLAHFCAKCCQMSTYETLPMVFVSNQEVPLQLACKNLVSDDLLLYFLEQLPSHKPNNKSSKASKAPKAVKTASPQLTPSQWLQLSKPASEVEGFDLAGALHPGFVSLRQGESTSHRRFPTCIFDPETPYIGDSWRNSCWNLDLCIQTGVGVTTKKPPQNRGVPFFCGQKLFSNIWPQVPPTLFVAWAAREVYRSNHFGWQQLDLGKWWVTSFLIFSW